MAKTDYPESNPADKFDVYVQHLAGEEGLNCIYTHGEDWIAHMMWMEIDGGWTARVEFFGENATGMLVVSGRNEEKEEAIQELKERCDKSASTKLPI